MAYTITGQPDQFQPVFNPMYFYMDSDNKSEEGFKYIVELYSAGTSNRFGQYKLFPRPVDGYGVADINQLLSTQVSYDINQTNNIIIPAPNSHVNYDVRFGEEFVFYWDWADNGFVSTGPYAGGQYSTLFSTGATNPFIAGDIILAQQNVGYSTEAYNGVFNVVSANSTTIIIDVPYVTATTVGGTARYSDARKTQYTGITSYTGYTAFNGAVGHQDLINYSYKNYTIDPTYTGDFLTDVPNTYRVKPENKMWLNMYSNNENGDTIYENTYNAELVTQYGTYSLINTNTGATPVQTLAIGPANVTSIEGTSGSTGFIQWEPQVGTLPVFKNICWDFGSIYSVSGGTKTGMSGATTSPWVTSYLTGDESVNIEVGGVTLGGFVITVPSPNEIIIDVPFSSFTATQGNVYQRVDWYTIQMKSFFGGVESSELQSFGVDWNETKYGNIELYFFDRLGSLIPANFELQNARSINVSRAEYQTLLGDLGRGPGDINKWGFKSTDRGRNTLNTTVKTVVTLNSNWLTELESVFLQELYSSPVVYIKEFNQLWPVMITSNNYNIVTKNNKKNIQIQITLEYANNTRINQI